KVADFFIGPLTAPADGPADRRPPGGRLLRGESHDAPGASSPITVIRFPNTRLRATGLRGAITAPRRVPAAGRARTFGAWHAGVPPPAPSAGGSAGCRRGTPARAAPAATRCAARCRTAGASAA